LIVLGARSLAIDGRHLHATVWEVEPARRGEPIATRDSSVERAMYAVISSRHLDEQAAYTSPVFHSLVVRVHGLSEHAGQPAGRDSLRVWRCRVNSHRNMLRLRLRWSRHFLAWSSFRLIWRSLQWSLCAVLRIQSTHAMTGISWYPPFLVPPSSGGGLHVGFMSVRFLANVIVIERPAVAVGGIE